MTTDALEFRCCDTTWRLARAPPEALEAARDRARALEARLDAFRPDSAVTRLAETGSSEDADVVRIVARGLEYRSRTDGVFDIRHGRVEHAVKAHIRTGAPRPRAWDRPARIGLDGTTVTTTAPLDLNGLAKGYIVDRVAEMLPDGLVDGGGDIATPPGPVGVQDPYGPGLAGVLDTRWNIATSGRMHRRRDAVDHLYDPKAGRVGALHDQVTVVARRDCMEADALATTLSVLPTQAGMDLLADWDGAEALWIDRTGWTMSPGFEDHVWKQ